MRILKKFGKFMGVYIGPDWSRDIRHSIQVFFFWDNDIAPGILHWKHHIAVYWNTPLPRRVYLNPYHNDPYAIRSERWTGIKTSPLYETIDWRSIIRWEIY